MSLFKAMAHLVSAYEATTSERDYDKRIAIDALAIRLLRATGQSDMQKKAIALFTADVETGGARAALEDVHEHLYLLTPRDLSLVMPALMTALVALDGD